MTTTQPEAVLLSLLGPRPAFFRNPQFPDILCAWNGIVMTQVHALMLASEIFWNYSPTPEMRHTADRRFLFLYKAGAFEQSDSWCNIVDNRTETATMHGWYQQKLGQFLIKNLSSTPPYQVFAWFDLAEWCKKEAENT